MDNIINKIMETKLLNKTEFKEILNNKFEFLKDVIYSNILNNNYELNCVNNNNNKNKNKRKI